MAGMTNVTPTSKTPVLWGSGCTLFYSLTYRAA